MQTHNKSKPRTNAGEPRTVLHVLQKRRWKLAQKIKIIKPMNPEKSSTTQNQKNQTNEPEKSNPWTHESKVERLHEPMNQTHEPINQKSRDCMNPWTHESNTWKIKPMNPWIKRERKRDLGLEREKKSEIDKERSKRMIQTQTTQTSKSQRFCAHVADLLCLFFFFFLRSISFSNSSGPIFFPLLFLSCGLRFFQPTQSKSKLSQIERDRD